MTIRLYPQLSPEQEETLWGELKNSLKKHFNKEARTWVKEKLLWNKAKYAPYHNNIHTTLTIIGALDIAEAITQNSPTALTEEDIRVLVVAALYHDYNHLESTTDSENIGEAITAFYEEVRKNKDYVVPENGLMLTWTRPIIVKKNPLFKDVPSKKVIKLIRKTNLSETLNPESDAYFLQTILRDADLIGMSKEEYRELLYKGLSEETGHIINDESTRKFLQTITLYHDYTKTQLKNLL